MDNFAKAIEYHQKCEGIARKHGQNRELMASLNNMGIISRDQKKFAEALRYYEEGLELAIEITDRKYESYFLSNISNVYFDQKKGGSRFVEGQPILVK